MAKDDMAPLRIKRICGMEPMREREFPVMFSVGVDGVTEIIDTTDNYGDHGIGWFEVHCGDRIKHRMQARAVAEVEYFGPSD
jgi:hypothetical protein